MTNFHTYALLTYIFYRECEEYTMSKIHCASDKNILSNFGKKSYEMIYCPETVNEIQFAQNRVLDDAMSSDTAKKSCKMKRQPSFGLSEKQSSKSLPGFTSKVGDSSRYIICLNKIIFTYVASRVT